MKNNARVRHAMPLRSLIFIGVFFLLVGCGVDTKNPVEEQVTIHLSKPFAAKLPGLSVTVEVRTTDNNHVTGSPFLLIQNGDETWSYRSDISPGDYLLAIIYRCGSHQVAQTNQVFSIRHGEQTVITKDAFVLDRSFEDDGDGFTNLMECRFGTNAGDLNSRPKMSVSPSNLMVSLGSSQNVQITAMGDGGTLLVGVEATVNLTSVGVATVTPAFCITDLDGKCFVTIAGVGVSAPITLTVNSDAGTATSTVEVVPIAPPTYPLTITTSGTGSGTTTGAGTYNHGQTATTTATANVGSVFTAWSGADGTACASGSVSMTANKTCTAHLRSTPIH